MNKYTIALLAILAMLAGTAHAQTATRVSGTIEKLNGNVLSVKAADGKSTDVQVDEKAEILFTQPIKLADIKQGDFLAVTSIKREDGVLTAFEVRRFPKPLNPGHRPFEGSATQTMTNATVATMVQSATGRELTMAYEGGTQKIIVSEKASISTLVPGELAQLEPGATVSMTAAPGGDGKLLTRRIQVSPPK
jgi:hypothetical protein